jgi:hypothetical protein
MNKYGLQLVSFETTTIYNTQIDHIWTNVLLQHLCIEDQIEPKLTMMAPNYTIVSSVFPWHNVYSLSQN